jgi:hypothetical protein
VAITTAASLQHWNYFLVLEDDLLQLSRFVDFAGNRTTYSLEIGRILTIAAAEVDVVMKQLCKQWDHTSNSDKIGGYFRVISSTVPKFKSFRVTIPRFGLTMKPWSSWTAQKPPLWWSANNKFKHQRHTHFADATLRNCLNATAGLYTAVLFLYSSEARTGRLSPPPKLFDVGVEHSLGQFIDRFIVPMVDVPQPPTIP